MSNKKHEIRDFGGDFDVFGVGATAHMPFNDYQAIPALNYSSFKRVKYSPAHITREGNSEDSPARKLGRLVHLLTFEPRREYEFFVVPENLPRRTAEQRRIADERDTTLRLSGITTVTHEMREKAGDMAFSARRHPAVAKMLDTNYYPELTIVWKDPLYPNAPLKARLDYYNRSLGAVADLKTCGIGQARPDKFISVACGSLSTYHWQAAWYRRGLQALGLPINAFLWIPVETETPFSTSVVNCSSEILDYANREIEQHLKAIVEFQKQNSAARSQAYGSLIVTPETPSWVKEKGLNE